MSRENNKKILPKNWIDCKLKDVGEIIAGGTPSTSELSYWGDEVSWITPADLSGYKSMYISKGRKSLSKKGLQNSSARLIPKGSVLFSSRAPIGYVVIASNELATNQGFKNIVPYSGIDSKYLYYYLIANKQLAEENASGTTFKEISATKFAELQLVLAPSNEQVRIAEKLDELLSELEKGKEQLQTSLEQLKVYRQSILKHAFEGKLSEEWRRKQKKLKTPDELLSEIRAYRKRQYEKQLKEYKAGKIKAKPKEPKDIKLIKGTLSVESGWALSKLGDVLETTSGGTPSRNNPRYYSGSIPWVKSGELKYNTILDTEEKISKEAIENSSAKLFPKGTLLVALYGATVGKLAFLGIEASTNQAVCGVFEEPYYDHKFLYYYLMFMRPELLNLSTGGAQPNISQTILSNLPVPICSKDEQLVVVEQIDKLFSMNDEMEKTIDENLLKSDALKQGLLQKAFEGKLVEQDPSDEPASVLLERIKKEREEYLKAEKERKKKKIKVTI